VGETKGIHCIGHARPANELLLSLFPNLTDFRITSEDSYDYNCLAWVVGDTRQWWSPWPREDYYWPVGKPRFITVQSIMVAYQVYGYEECSDGKLETGYEKIAIYAKDGEPTHAAKQLESGRWTSKLGELQDIEHGAPEELQGDQYGEIVTFMRRAKD
jgi:hypothetical protein